MINWYQSALSIIIFAIITLVMFGLIANISAEEQYTLVKKWGSKGINPGQFDQPQNLVIDSSSNVFVADFANHRIQKFDSNGNFMTQWGSYCDVNALTSNCVDPDGSGPLDLSDAQFSYPSDLAVDSSDNLYVVDHFNFRIQKFDANGNFITKWGLPGTGDGQFRTPYAIAVDSSDNVYVADFLNHRIQKFTKDGEFVTKWGSQGTGDGEFKIPRGIAVDSSDIVYVVDANHRVQKFDADGDFISKWGSYCAVGPGPDDRCIDPDGTGPFVAGDGQFNEPFGIDVDSSNNLYVADSLNYRMEKFDSNGKFITKWGSHGSEDGQFNNPRGIATDTSNKIYVADTDNNRIQVYGINNHIVPLAVNLDRPAACQDVTATMKGISLRFTITGLYHLDTTYRYEVHGTSGSIIIDESNGIPVAYSLPIPDDAPNPATTTLGLTFATHDSGIFRFSIFGSDGSQASLDFNAPLCLADTTPPNTSINFVIDGHNKNVENGGLSSSESITFSFDGTDNEGIQGFNCNLDQNNAEICSSPKTYPNINEGEHTFSVLAIDTSSNEDPTPATFDWNIDTTKPIVTVPSSDLVVQASSSSGAVVTFSATAHDNIDGDIAATCTPASGSIFAIGNTNVNCAATDKAGNTGMSSFSVVVKEPPKPAAEHTSLSLVINPNRAVAIGQDYSLTGRPADGITGRKLVGGQDISFTSDPYGIISIPIVKTDASGKFGLSKLKAPDKDGTYKIVAHFAGSPFLQPSDSNPILLKVEKKATLLQLQVKGNPISGATLNGELIDLVTRKGISSQIISFTANKPDLVVHNIISDSKGKYKISLPPFECGTANIQMQSHFIGTDVFKPSDSRVSVLNIPRCLSSPQSSPSSFDIRADTNSSDNN